MRVLERHFLVGHAQAGVSLLDHLHAQVHQQIPTGAIPLRFLISESGPHGYSCELAALAGVGPLTQKSFESVFKFRERTGEDASTFNVVVLVPTGIGAEIGGHAGDACPVVRVIGEVCDRVITHPNAVNASDINEMPANALYVEGSVISRLLMGTVGLRVTRSNRVLVIVNRHAHSTYSDAAINSVSAARASYGLQCPCVIELDPGVRLVATYGPSGAAGGRIEGLEQVCEVLEERRGAYDAVAISSPIEVPPNYHMDYFESEGDMVNPWGGVEAMLTHAISGLYNVPSAHSPMLESDEIANLDPGVVDPRMAAEAVSFTFLNCILKGLMRSPRLVTDTEAMLVQGTMTAGNVSCLVIPDGCVGLPTLAAMQQGIPVIAVRENRNVMKNDLKSLPWASGQLFVVSNYWEAVGVLAAIKGGVAPDALRRPLSETIVETRPVEAQPALLGDADGSVSSAGVAFASGD